MADGSNKPDKLVIFGAGGHGRELAWLAQMAGWKAADIMFVVDSREYLSAPVNGIPVLLLADLSVSGTRTGFVVALGDSRLRERAADKCLHAGLEPVTLQAPGALLSDTVRTGAGSVICAGSILTTNVTLGRHVHVNIGCTISHDARIADFATLSPGVRLSGHVVIGEHAFLGTGAVVINGSEQHPLVIGANAVVAAGACVTTSVAAGSLVAGVPAVQKR
ncbi:MAG: NeuD/PglB/VioB family sugar acetyltransferase [Pseudomonadota bacterium]